ncbi:hypothetical protein NDN08_005233 [Rhodosorus marinus]|uniref:BRO1 domain-containing protein n=1 Tax=Rhodosorus marinus TaxID=101924 RepID=A0AAV8V105_9RHOD|nr:hypothetical protein NDN08_005233 [Rhodosorus marinus]
MSGSDATKWFLRIPLKKSKRAEVADVVYEALEAQHDPETAKRCLDGCKALQRMKEEVVRISELGNVNAAQEAIDTMLDYIRGLDYAGTRVEISVNNKFNFVWSDTVTGGSVGTSNIAVERANVMFNIAMEEAAMGVAGLRHVSFDTLKVARGRFQTAAGYFDKICSVYVTGENAPLDVHESFAQVMRDLMLINAQIVFLQAARVKSAAPDLLGALSMGVVRMIDDLAYKLVAGDIAGWSNKHGLVELFKGWGKFYLASTYLDMGANFDKTNNMRDRLAVLYAADQLAYEVANTTKKLVRTDVTKDLIQFLSTDAVVLSSKIREERKLAEEENNLTEHTSASDVVPNLAPRISATPFFNEEVLVKPVPEGVARTFSTILHKSLAATSRKYMGDVKAIVTSELAMIDRAANPLKSVESELEDIGAPKPEAEFPALAEHAKQAGGLEALVAKEQEVSKLSQESWLHLAEIEKLLAAESAEDEKARQETNGAIRRPFSTDLNRRYYEKCNRIRSELQRATAADDGIKSRFDSSRSLLKALDPPQKQDLPGNENFKERSDLLVEIEAVLKSMRKLVGDFNAAWAGEAAKLENMPTEVIDREEFLRNNLRETFDPLKGRNMDTCTVAEDVTERARAFLDNQGGEAPPKTDGPEAARRAAESWGQLMSEWEQGVDFYNKEMHVLQRLQLEVGDFVAARRTELKDHLDHIGAAFQQMSMNNPPPSGPQYSAQPPGHYSASAPHAPPNVPGNPNDPYGGNYNPQGGYHGQYNPNQQGHDRW